MRWFGLVLIVFIVTSTAWAQADSAAGGPVGESVVGPVGGPVGGPVVGTPVPGPTPIPYGFSNSVIDHNGRLLLFSVTYEYPTLTPGQAKPVRFPPTVKTRLTIIENNAIKGDYMYSGAFQVISVGRYAVYAMINDYSIAVMSAQAPVSAIRRLVALGPSIPTLPSIDLTWQTEVKASAVGDNGAPDTIAIIDTVQTPVMLAPTGAVMPLPTIPTRERTVRMFQYDGGNSFTPPAPKPIPIP